MIARYSATLALVVLVITYGLSALEFASRSQVMSGKTVDESLQFEFTLDEDSDHTYKITPPLKEFLEESVRFHGEGPVRVLSAKVEITPKDVSWTRNRTTITSTGAAMAVQLQWTTPADSASGTHGSVYMDFPKIPGFESATTSFHSGGYQEDDSGRYVVREVTAYRSAFQVSVGRFVIALAAGLPFGILLHIIYWGFALKGEKRSRIAALPPQGPGLPQTFYPNPITEWITWLFVLGLGGVMSSIVAGFSLNDGFMSSSITETIYIILAVAVAIALISIYFVSKRVLTVRVDTQGIAYARGRAELQWLNAAWSEILTIVEKSRTNRGSTTYWMEVQFNDKRKKLKITKTIEGYAALRDLLMGMYTVPRQGG